PDIRGWGIATAIPVAEPVVKEVEKVACPSCGYRHSTIPLHCEGCGFSFPKETVKTAPFPVAEPDLKAKKVQEVMEAIKSAT
ncbi:hypothetical protein ACSTK2_23300, partial [Vibrio parahaemolyticus]